jgi:hypothetical protein
MNEKHTEEHWQNKEEIYKKTTLEIISMKYKYKSII